MAISFRMLRLCLLTIAITSFGGARPLNVVLFVVDDFGAYDVSYAGSSVYETPEIDRLAADAVQFTQAYSAYPRCVPSRFGLMTGTHPSRAEGMGEQLGDMEPSRVTLAEALKAQGYATFFAGKWHLGKQATRWPQGQGYDVNIAGGSAGAPGSYFAPYQPNGKLIGPETLDAPAGEYITDRLTTETVDYIQKMSRTDQPFFVTLCHYAVHTPIEGKPEKTARYQTKIDALKFEGDDYEITPDGRHLRHQSNAEYAGMIESVDESLGRVVATLKALGIYDDTLIVFTSDHGGLSNSGPSSKRALATTNAPLRAGKGHLYEGGIRVPMIVRWPGVTAAGASVDRPTTGLDIFPTVLDMLGLPTPANATLDGMSVAASLRDGGNVAPERPLFWYSDRGRRASTGDRNAAVIRRGDYKLVQFFTEGRVELYHLKNDPSEAHDLAATQTAIRDALLAELAAWKAAMKVKDRKQEKSRAGPDYDF